MAETAGRNQPTADAAAAIVARPAAAVFAFMADPHRLDLWSFGTWRVAVADDGLVVGTGIYDGTRTFVRIDADGERMLIDYAVGPAADALCPRIFARVTRGEVVGLGRNHALLTIVGLRSAGMDAERWRRLRTAHAFEVELIRSILESGFDHRTLR